MSGNEAVRRRLHPAILISRSLRIVPQMLAGGAGYAAVIQREGFGKILLFAALAAGLGLIGALLSWWRFRYTISAGEIVIERGLFNRQRRVIPFDRVQDIAIERRLLARLLGTAKVNIETGGSAADEGHLDMIGLADAITLRDRIKRWQGADLQSAAVPTAVDEPEPLLFAMTVPRTLLAGLFNFSLVFLALLFAAFQYLDDFGLVRIQDWLTPVSAEEVTAHFSLGGSIILATLLLALGLIAGVGRTLGKEFGFRLTRTTTGFRRRRGLLTLSEAVIPLHRMQVGLIQSGILAGRLGWHSLAFQTLGADQKEGGVQAAAPFARMEEITPLLEEARFPSPPPRQDFNALPRRALVSRAVPWLLLGIGAAIAALLVDPKAALAAVMMLLPAGFATARWRRHSWALGDRALTVTGGLLKRRTWIVPFDKAQSISVYQGPLQRRLSLATVLVDSAGASVLRSPEIVDIDAGDAARLAARLLALFHLEKARAKAATNSRT
ncbi:MAG: PH domain-containing protein [Allosphingosinicella sp.]